jgi:hypothetical protein
MRSQMLCVAFGATLLLAMVGSAGAQVPNGVPLNQVMPRLPPVPDPVRRPRTRPNPACNDRAAVPSVGSATSAEQTPSGIRLYGGEGPDTQDNPPAPPPNDCPLPPR